MGHRPAQLAILLALVTAVCAGTATCKFTAQDDYGNEHKKQPPGWPKKDLTQQACCEACSTDVTCVAAVLSPDKKGDKTGGCWLKDKVDIKQPHKPCCGKISMACVLEERDDGEEVNGGVPLNPGVFALLILGGAGVLYCGGGYAVGLSRGQRRHPHEGMWRDGLARLKGGGRSRVADRASRPSKDDVENGRPKRSSNAGSIRSTGSGKSGKSGRSKKGKKEKKDRRKSDDLTAPLAAAPPTAVEPPPAPEWQPTRTGHLAVGARETGVKVAL